jgi:sortase (surface protein transpeptidase)
MALRRKNKLLLVSRLVFLAAIIVLLVGIAISYSQHEANKIADRTPPHIQAVSNSSPESPPTTEKPKPSAFDAYKVAPDLPRYLFIPKLSIKAMIKPMGVTADNRIEAPRSAYDVGWYNGSAKPGQAGAMFLDGHVSAGRTPGIFYDLKNLIIGDTFTLERGDGQTFTYRVVKAEAYDVDNVDMHAALAPINPAKPGLNLITCTGNVIKGTNNYDKRLVVFTEQL